MLILTNLLIPMEGKGLDEYLAIQISLMKIGQYGNKFFCYKFLVPR